jgi:hypothetical protein
MRCLVRPGIGTALAYDNHDFRLPVPAAWGIMRRFHSRLPPDIDD